MWTVFWVIWRPIVGPACFRFQRRGLLSQKDPAYIETLLHEPFEEALQQWCCYDAEIFFQMTREYRTAGGSGPKEDNHTKDNENTED
jgi:hypothetical protein